MEGSMRLLSQQTQQHLLGAKAVGDVDDLLPTVAFSTCISACQNMSIRAIRFASGGCVAKSSETPSAKNI
jgi:hypothetical protein